ncbi:MAG TPA: DUF481 domain-containing protein, partial [Opitutaceae bacterium]|nr:DUF481 domain-containing protein [Opitutaceae bacterium]
APAPPTAPVAPAVTVAAQPPAGTGAPLPGSHRRVTVSSPLPSKPGAAPAASWWWPWWVARPFLVLEPVVTHWIGKVEFGYDNNLTTTRAVTTTTRLEADRISGPDNFQFKGSYLYGRSDHVPTTDQDELDFRWRHNLDARLFTEATSTYSQDKIRQINDNLEQGGSFGYRVFANQTQSVDFGLGLIGQYLDATGVQQGADYFGHVFQDYTYKINGRFTLAQDVSADYSPEKRARFGVTTIGSPVNSQAQDYDYKFHSTLEGKITDHMSLNLHFEYDYDNAVLDPHARAEQHVTTTVGYSF